MSLLYHHSLNASARFIRILLAEKQFPVRLVEERDWEGREAFLALNPAGEVPVLLLESGIPLSGARAIAEYLEETTSGPSLLGDNPLDRCEVRRLVDWFHSKLASEVTRHTLSEKLLKRVYGKGEPDSEVVRCAAYNLKTHLRYVEYLTKDRNYLAGKHFTMADAAAAANFSVEDYFGTIAWSAYPAAKEWYVRIKSRKSLRAVLADRITGVTPPSHYANPDF